MNPWTFWRWYQAFGIEWDPVLQQMDMLLDDDQIVEAIKSDLAKRHPRTLTDGRPSTPVEVILRMLVVKHFYGWSYAQTCQVVAGSLLLRQFCRLYTRAVPSDKTLLRWANLIQPATLHFLHIHSVAVARQQRITRGRKLRSDGTVVATNIHYPVDSTLLGDGVRVLTRTIQRAKELIPKCTVTRRSMYRDRTGSVRRVMRGLIATARRRGEEAADALKDQYRRLVTLTQQIVRQAEQIEQVENSKFRRIL